MDWVALFTRDLLQEGIKLNRLLTRAW